MKKLFTIFAFAILTASITRVEAQSADAPTKQDAVDFIKKINTEFVYDNEHGMPTFSTVKKYIGLDITLNNCLLKIVAIHKFIDIEQSTTTINLSSVSLVQTFRVNSEGVKDSTWNIIAADRKSDIAVVWDGKRMEMLEGEISINYINSYPFGLDTENDIFKSHNYSERLLKAWQFLIKSCGGGKVKVDPNEKF